MPCQNLIIFQTDLCLKKGMIVIMENIEKEKAMDIIVNGISQIMNKWMENKDEQKAKELKEKFNVLQGMKDEIYKGNEKIIKKVIEIGDIKYE